MENKELVNYFIKDLRRYFPHIEGTIYNNPHIRYYRLESGFLNIFKIIQDGDDFEIYVKTNNNTFEDAYKVPNDIFKAKDAILKRAKRLRHKFYPIEEDIYGDILVFYFEQVLRNFFKDNYRSEVTPEGKLYYASNNSIHPIFAIRPDKKNILRLGCFDTYPSDNLQDANWYDLEIFLTSNMNDVATTYFMRLFFMDVAHSNEFINMNEIFELNDDKILKKLTYVNKKIEFLFVTKRQIKGKIYKENNIKYLTIEKGKDNITLPFENSDDFNNAIQSLYEQDTTKQAKKKEEPVIFKYPKAQELEIKFDEAKDDITKLDELGNIIDSLTEEELQIEEISRVVNKFSIIIKHSIPIHEKIRNLYISKEALKAIEGLDMDDMLPALQSIKENFLYLKGESLVNYIVGKNLVNIYGYHKIRIKNNIKHRLVFLFGNEKNMHGDPNDIYIIEYIKDHDFKFLKDINPSARQYFIWGDKVNVPKPDEVQEIISESFGSPIICTGCAGSGKTLISVFMYWKLMEAFKLDKPFGTDISYVTFNEYAKINAENQIKQKTDQVHCYNIQEFFTNLINGDFDKLGIKKVPSNVKLDQLTPIELKALSLKKQYKETFDNSIDVNEDNYVDEQHFYNWFKKGLSDHQFKDKLYKLKDEMPDFLRYLYTFFRGVYKGSLCKWELDPLKYNHLTYSQFEKQLKSENIKDNNRISLVYETCEKYQKYLDDNELYDDNDLARLIIKKFEKQGFCRHIIIDEVQDLTDVQLEAIVRCAIDKNNIYFFGDQNQAINPTLFNIDFIENCLMHNDIEVDENHKFSLNSSYRFGPLLAKYINELVEKKRTWIGSTGIDETESSSKTPETDKWGGKSTNQEVNIELLKKASLSANAMIIVPNKEVIKELEKLGIDPNRATTIYDSKGLEWDYIILYKMLKFNGQSYHEMMDGKAIHSTFHRMIFNQYYVACTRARSCFTVLEDGLDKDIETSMLQTLPNVSKDNMDFYLNSETDELSWEKEADRLFATGNYALARGALQHCNNANERLEICMIMENLDELASEDSALLCKNKGYYREARIIYEKLGNKLQANIMNLMLDRYIDDVDLQELIESNLLDEEALDKVEKLGFFKRLNEKNNERFKNIHKMMEDINNEIRRS